MRKKQSKIAKYLISAILCICLIMNICTSFAQNDCHLTVNVRSENGTEAISDFEVRLCQVAISEAGILRLSDSFSSSGLSISSLTGSGNAEKAKAVCKYIKDNNIPCDTLYTDEYGNAAFTNLKRGIYTVFAKEGQSVYFDPFIVVLPMNINGVNNHYVTSVPKTTDKEQEAPEVIGKSIDVTVIWDDGDNKHGKRPGSVTVTLMRDGAPYKNIVLDESNNWKHTFKNLISYGSFAVVQDGAYEYETVYSGNAETGFLIVNKYTGDDIVQPPEEDSASISVCKVWDDKDNEALARPGSVTVQLIEDGIAVKTASLSEENGWKHTFSGLDKNSKYTVKEILPKDYSANYSGNVVYGFVIINTYTEGKQDPGVIPEPEYPSEPQSVDISVKKLWDDEENAENKRPKEIKINLIANSSIVRTLTLSQETGWEGTFESVPSNLAYTVLEDTVEGYSAEYSGNAKDGYVITNKYDGEKTDPGTPPEPSVPDIPDVPDTPDTPDTPGKDEPQKPIIPQTGAVTLPIYILMAVGTVLVLAGAVDLFFEREEK